MTLSAAGIARVKRVLIAPFPIPLRSNIYDLTRLLQIHAAEVHARKNQI